MRILVAGMVAGDPGQGGATWAVLQYVHGLRRLGHDVRLVEPVPRLTAPVREYFVELGLDGAALLVQRTRQTLGVSYDALAGFGAELLLNVSGMLAEPELMGPIPVRVFLDLDPAFNQIWHAEGLHPTLAQHTHHVTVGLRLGKTSLPVDRKWTPTFPPVVLDDWPYADALETDAFTTVGHWRSYGSAARDGTFYGQRAHAVRRLLDLPSLSGQPLRPALAIDPEEVGDLQALHEHGWHLLDPAEAAGTPESYRRFVAGSRGEIGFAKAGYVDSRCGWFSDRSACYLACGRPVVAQDTGFSEVLPTGEGLLAFETSSQAAAALRAVGDDYEHHRRAARSLAEQWFDSDRVLTRLLEQVL